MAEKSTTSILGMPWTRLAQAPFSNRPFAFISAEQQADISNIFAVELLEESPRAQRARWTSGQLTNLANHARQNSQFWQRRLGSRPVTPELLPLIPPLSRRELMQQVKEEGAIVKAQDGRALLTYTSTGSTGVPVRIYALPQNAYYNKMRGLAQFFIDGLPLHFNRVKINPSVKSQKSAQSATVEKSWTGPLGQIFETGSYKKITFGNSVEALIAELRRDQVGYLNCPSRYIEMILAHGGASLFAELGVRAWLHLSDLRNAAAVESLEIAGVQCLSNYSAAEVGPIAFECRSMRNHFHVATSNVIVEADRSVTAEIDGAKICRLLVSHLHSFATPLIRYDIGDMGEVLEGCPCGHDGPTLRNIAGRRKHFLRHPSGKLIPFYISARTIKSIVPFRDCRIRQTSTSMIEVEIERDPMREPAENWRMRLTESIKAVSDPEFEVTVRIVPAIEWGTGSKRLFFTSYVE
jgi:phenylacetate-coenzyme A ligase PaaK-like adenylate-forming protein